MKNLKVTTGFIPERCSDENAVGITKFSMSYEQNGDWRDRDPQEIILTAENEVGDDDTWYVNIEIPKGKHWSVTCGNDIKELVDDFIHRLKTKTVKADTLNTY